MSWRALVVSVIVDLARQTITWRVGPLTPKFSNTVPLPLRSFWATVCILNRSGLQ